MGLSTKTRESGNMHDHIFALESGSAVRCGCCGDFPPSRNMRVAEAKSLTAFATSRSDPTRTLTLRKEYVVQMNRRFNWLKSIIREVVVDDDVFGLNKTGTVLQAAQASAFKAPNVTKPGKQRYAFNTDAEKVDLFMDWLQDAQERGILGVQEGAVATSSNWQRFFVRSAYLRGIRDAFRKVKNVFRRLRGLPEVPPETRLFQSKRHADAVQLLYTRNFRGLKGITEAMDLQISRVLADGLSQGLGPAQIARNINAEVEGIGIVRARMLARTEIVRAHHIAQINEYEELGISGVEVEVEWVTAGTGVCPICAKLEGKRFTLAEIRPLIPVHPNCRCSARPVNVEE